MEAFCTSAMMQRQTPEEAKASRMYLADCQRGKTIVRRLGHLQSIVDDPTSLVRQIRQSRKGPDAEHTMGPRQPQLHKLEIW
jgi:hypothetical protein